MMKVWILEYARWDESFCDSIYSTETLAQKALDSLGPNVRKYYSVKEMEVVSD